MSARPRVLFISHSASRNGATILLLHLLRWLKGVVDWDVEIVVDGRGPLLEEFRSIGRTVVWRSPARVLEVFSEHRRAAWQPRLEAWSLKALLRGRRFDLIYANTAATWPHVSALMRSAPALLWHIHELDYALRVAIPREWASKLFCEATRFVAVSSSVGKVLALEYDVPGEKIESIPGCVPFPNLTYEERRSRRQRVSEELGWPARRFVVGGCGSLGWRKGTDLFLQVARTVCSMRGYEHVRFVWVGGGMKDMEALEFDHDVRILGLEGRCSRVPATAAVLDYYCAMDVFALTSREDPFPLVMLEAGALGVPVVCFADSGGGPEFVGSDAGLIADYLDVSGFVAHVVKLHNTPDERERLGAVASRRVQSEHSVGTQAAKLLKVIERELMMARSGAGSHVSVPACSVPRSDSTR